EADNREWPWASTNGTTSEKIFDPERVEQKNLDRPDWSIPNCPTHRSALSGPGLFGSPSRGLHPRLFTLFAFGEPCIPAIPSSVTVVSETQTSAFIRP